ncbi:hypothetical protein [Shewanella baltica]|uniref:hypothetical protein n=1 Tax=Shewanella baltica TaxID=62322 RepID=UPI0024B9216A|nr:hypothetical protein [Shewanella baltica]
MEFKIVLVRDLSMGDMVSLPKSSKITEILSIHAGGGDTVFIAVKGSTTSLGKQYAMNSEAKLYFSREQRGFGKAPLSCSRKLP